MEVLSSLLQAIHFRAPASLTPDTVGVCFLSIMQDVLLQLCYEPFERYSPPSPVQGIFYGVIQQFHLLTLTKKGLKRTMGSAPRQKHPSKPDILVSMRRFLDLTTLPHAALWALFTTAFFSFLRKSNLVAASAFSFNSDQHLAWHDIKFTDSGALLGIKWSKTRQFKEGAHLIPLPRIPNSPLCPVSAIRHYFTLVPAPSVAPFFCLPTDQRPGFTPLTATYFTSSLKRLIVTLGLDAANYSPHSFRRGGATYAYQAGVPEHLIKLRGDWLSDVYQVYLSLPLPTRGQVADIMAAGLFANT